jgi:hypothetical protein
MEFDNTLEIRRAKRVRYGKPLSLLPPIRRDMTCSRSGAEVRQVNSMTGYLLGGSKKFTEIRNMIESLILIGKKEILVSS